MLTINLEKKLIAQKTKDIEAADVDGLLDQVEQEYIVEALDKAGFSQKSVVFNKNLRRKNHETKLQANRVFTTEQIKRVCILYGLRFLPTKFYQGTVAPEAVRSIHKLEETLGKKVNASDFRIAAPAESFELQRRPKDPLLFYSLGNDNWYLVAKWGRDLWVTRLLMQAIKRFAPFVVIAGLLPLSWWLWSGCWVVGSEGRVFMAIISSAATIVIPAFMMCENFGPWRNQLRWMAWIDSLWCSEFED